MVYPVSVLPSAERELKRLPGKDAARIFRALEKLAAQPRPVGVQKLRGARDRYRVRVGAYGVLYRLDDGAKRIFIYAVRHRKDVYR